LADDAGALLVRSGLIAAEHLAAARATCAEVGGTLGEHLVAAALITDEALTEFYRSRLLVPQVNPNSLARLPKDVIAAVPADMAVEFRVVPVSIDREGNLTVAMSDPSNRHAVDEIAFFTGRYVVRAVATQMQIAWCLAHYYGHITELGTRLLRPVEAEESGPTSPGRLAHAAAPLAPVPRTKGITGRVEASRHKALAPITRPPIDQARPDPQLLDPKARVPVPAARPATPPPAAAAALPVSPRVPAIGPNATTLRPGQISAADVAKATAELEVDGEVIEIADYPSGPIPPQQQTQPTGRARVPDPPELAARAGEVLVREATERNPFDEPAVVIAVDRLEQSAPIVFIDSDGERSAPAPLDDSEDSEDEPTATDTDVAAAPIAARAAGDATPAGAVDARANDEDHDQHDHDHDDDDDLDEPTHADALPPGDDALVALSDEGPAVVHDRLAGTDSQPILLERKRTMPEFAPIRLDSDPGLPDAEPAVSDRADTEDDDQPTGTTTPAPAAAAAADDDTDVVLLSRPKTRTPRPEKRTQVGIGALGSIVARPAVAANEPGGATVRVVLTAPPEIPSEADRTMRVPVDYAPEHQPPEITTSMATTAPVSAPAAPAVTTPNRTPPSFASGRSASVSASARVVAGNPTVTSDPLGDAVPRAFVDDDDDRKTHPVDALSGARTPRGLTTKMQEIDDGWGPPGTTIPPPFIGANTGMDDTSPSVKIPIASGDDESGPLVVKPASGPLADAARRAAEAASDQKAAPRAPIKSSFSNKTIANPMPPIPAPPASGSGPTPRPGSAPHRTPTAPPTTLLAAPPRPPTSQLAKMPSSPGTLAKDLEEASTTLLELLRELERAQTRDQVIELLVGHLARSHGRVGFFAVKGGELQPFALRPPPPGPLPTLVLSRASTFQDVVGTRLPYRGPVVDDATRRLLVAAFASAPDEMLALPVAIKERVVGIAYGDSRQRHTFDEQLAIAARAAGQALERILKSHKRAV
jgi:MshEN domain